MAVLAAFDPEDSRWPALADQVTLWLAEENPLMVGTWVEMLDPVRSALLPSLIRLFRESTVPEVRTVANNVLGRFAADHMELLVGLLKDADPTQFAALIPATPRTKRRSGGSLSSCAQGNTYSRMAGNHGNGGIPNLASPSRSNRPRVSSPTRSRWCRVCRWSSSPNWSSDSSPPVIGPRGFGLILIAARLWSRRFGNATINRFHGNLTHQGRIGRKTQVPSGGRLCSGGC